MTIQQLDEACARISILLGYTTKDGDHDLTNAVLELQVCLQEMGKRDLNKLTKILEGI